MSRHRSLPRLALIVAAVLTVPTVTAAAPPPDPGPVAPKPAAIRAWDAAAEQLRAASGAQSLSVALVDDGTVTWSDTYGTIDAAGTPPAADTRYGIGSISKTFAAVTILRLVDQGLIDLDAPITRYLPDLRLATPDAATITVRMLLAHTAGLPGSDYANAETFSPHPDYIEQLFETLRTARLKAAPGAMAVYCNDCFSLLEPIVESVTGEVYRDVVTETILRPLGMRDSGYPWLPFPAGTWAPVLDEDGIPTPMDRVNLDASGGLFSTPADMARFAAMLAGGGELDGVRILSPAAVALMGTDQTPGTFRLVDPATDPVRYGLGFDTVAVRALAEAGVTAWAKGGDITAYHASMVIVPSEGLAAIVQGAGLGFSSGQAQLLATRILLRALADQGVIARVPRPLPTVTSRPVTPSVAQRASLAGVYPTSGSAFRVQVDETGRARLSMLANGAWVDAPDAFSLRPDGWWWAETGEDRALGTADGWGRHYLVVRAPDATHTALEDVVYGQRMPAVDPLPAAWSARLDRPYLPVTEVASSTLWAAPAITLVEHPELPGLVQVRFPGNDQFVIPASDALAVAFLVIPQMQGRDLVDVAAVDRGGQGWLRLMGLLVRPADGIPALRSGSSTLTVEDGQTVTWRRATQESAISVTGAQAWKVFDAALAPVGAGDGDAPAVVVPAGGYLAVFADPGRPITLTTR